LPNSTVKNLKIGLTFARVMDRSTEVLFSDSQCNKYVNIFVMVYIRGAGDI